MRRTLQRGARARLSFPGEPRASVNMTNSMQLPVGRLFLVPRKRGKSRRTSRVFENLAYEM